MIDFFIKRHEIIFTSYNTYILMLFKYCYLSLNCAVSTLFINKGFYKLYSNEI